MLDDRGGPSSHPIDFGDLNHVGVVVGDLEGAMADLGGAFGLEWTGVRSGDLSGVRFVKSTGSGVFVELIEAKDDTLWNTASIGVQHIGIRVPDLAAACRRLEESGATQVTRVHERPPQTGAVYFRLRSGLVLEISPHATQ